MPVIKSLLSFSLLAALAGTAFAQASNEKLSDSERARRDAEKVFSFIKFHTVKPAAAAKPAAPAPAPVAAAKPAPRVAAAPAASSVAAATAPGVTNATGAVSAPAATANVASNVAAPLSAASPAAVPAAGAAPAVATTLPPASEPVPVAETAAAPPAVEEDDEVPLKLIAYVQPEMNAQVLAAMNGSQVVVPVRFVVQPDGRVSEARSTGSAPRRVANAAVRAVQQWRFDPIPAVREVDVELAFKPGE